MPFHHHTPTSDHNLNNEHCAITLEKLQQELDEMFAGGQRSLYSLLKKMVGGGWKEKQIFFNLERRNAEWNFITKLKIDDAVCEDSNGIAKKPAHFYANLYQPCSLSQTIWNPVKDAKTVSEGFTTECSRRITLEEILSSIKDLQNNKLPGNDGRTSEFYKTLAKGVTEFLPAVYDEALREEEVPPSSQQGLADSLNFLFKWSVIT